jgi:hypothetical protein
MTGSGVFLHYSDQLDYPFIDSQLKKCKITREFELEKYLNK